MLNLLLRILLAVSAMVLLVVLIGSLLPRDFETTASVTINAEPARIFPYLHDLQQWPAWSPWNARAIPGLVVETGEQTSGVGATQVWTHDRGNGKMWITDVEEPNRIAFESVFAGHPRLKNEIRLEKESDVTTVTWTSSGSMPQGPAGYFRSMVSASLGDEFGKSLELLKQLVEGDAGTATDTPQ